MHKKYLFILPLLTAPFVQAALTTEEQLTALQGQMVQLKTRTEEQAEELAALRAAQQPAEETPVVTVATETAGLSTEEILKREATRIAEQLTDPETHTKVEKEAKRVEKQVKNFFKKW
jgi:type II secretory pathway component PulM